MSGARAAALATLALGAALAPAAALGWGAQGHRVAGLVAESLLDARTRAALQELTGGEPLAELSLVLDRDKRALEAAHPGSARWHFDNHPACEPAAPLASYCRDGDCASGAYATYLAVLKDRRAAHAERLFALEVVAHVLEDVHQPLHVANHADRGGNDVRVWVGRRRRTESLHAAWDIDFVREAMDGGSERALASALVDEYRPERTALAAGDFARWTRDSFALARSVAYGELPGFACAAPVAGAVRLPRAYVEDATRTVRAQLALAGIRLARVLEESL